MLRSNVGQLVGLCGQWRSAPPTSAMNWSAAVGQEIGPNDRSDLQAIAGHDPDETVDMSSEVSGSRSSNPDLRLPLTRVPVWSAS